MNMANMSYCRFRNTLGDLRDCFDNMEEPIGSREEARARRNLVELCETISNEYRAQFTDSDHEVEDAARKAEG